MIEFIRSYISDASDRFLSAACCKVASAVKSRRLSHLMAFMMPPEPAEGMPCPPIEPTKRAKGVHLPSIDGKPDLRLLIVEDTYFAQMTLKIMLETIANVR